VTNGPQTNPGDMTPSWSARRNVIESQHYDRLLETNRGPDGNIADLSRPKSRRATD
jgi:hypothetical protein